LMRRIVDPNVRAAFGMFNSNLAKTADISEYADRLKTLVSTYVLTDSTIRILPIWAIMVTKLTSKDRIDGFAMRDHYEKALRSLSKFNPDRVAAQVVSDFQIGYESVIYVKALFEGYSWPKCNKKLGISGRISDVKPSSQVKLTDSVCLIEMKAFPIQPKITGSGTGPEDTTNRLFSSIYMGAGDQDSTKANAHVAMTMPRGDKRWADNILKRIDNSKLHGATKVSKLAYQGNSTPSMFTVKSEDAVKAGGLITYEAGALADARVRFVSRSKRTPAKMNTKDKFFVNINTGNAGKVDETFRAAKRARTDL